MKIIQSVIQWKPKFLQRKNEKDGVNLPADKVFIVNSDPKKNKATSPTTEIFISLADCNVL